MVLCSDGVVCYLRMLLTLSSHASWLRLPSELYRYLQIKKHSIKVCDCTCGVAALMDDRGTVFEAIFCLGLVSIVSSGFELDLPLAVPATGAAALEGGLCLVMGPVTD